MNDKRILLEQLYKEYSYLMLHVAYEILQDKNLAEDAVHTAFLNLSKYDFEIFKVKCKKTKSFLVTVVKNAAIDLYKKQKKIYLIEDQKIETEDPSPPPLETIVSEDSLKILEDAIDTMDPKYATVLKLKYLYDYPVDKIAKALSISEDNVYVRLHRAKKMLIAQLNKGDEKHENKREA